MKINIYLDESGDLGWTFSAPYRHGGSSRHLTIACLIVPDNKKHLPKRIIQRLYKKHKWDTKAEKKWSEMKLHERIDFASKAKQLQEKNSDIKYISITVKKENVLSHIRSDSNKLYNYMIGLALLEKMCCFQNVCFIPDPRSIKVESGNSLHDYLQTKIWFEHQAATILETIPHDSASNKNVQFADMLSGVIQGYYEDGYSDPWNVLNSAVETKRLYFR